MTNQIVAASSNAGHLWSPETAPSAENHATLKTVEAVLQDPEPDNPG